MSAFENLLQSAGTWQGLNRLQIDATKPNQESQTRLIITPLLAGTFLRIDQTWSWEGKEQFGSMLIGQDPKTNQSTIHWIDTWHNGKRVMPLVGQFNAEGRLVALGSFAVENGPDWGWRIEIDAQPNLLKIEMFCVTPDGIDDGGVSAEFTRV